MTIQVLKRGSDVNFWGMTKASEGAKEFMGNCTVCFHPKAPKTLHFVLVCVSINRSNQVNYQDIV